MLTSTLSTLLAVIMLADSVVGAEAISSSIAEAGEHAPSTLLLSPVPWQDGEELQLALKLTNGLDVGTMVYRARATELDGRKVWDVGARMFARVQSVSHALVSVDDFRPIRSRWMHVLLGDVTATYGVGEVSLQTAGQKEPKVVKVEGIVYDNEEIIHLVRRLPLAVGYKAKVSVFSSLAGGGGIPVSVEVVGTEPVETAAGSQECFKVELKPINQIFWFSTDPKRTVYRFTGGGVTAELVSISHHAPGESVHYTNESLGISLTAPPDWIIHFQDPDKEPNFSTIFLLDPDALADNCILRLHAMSVLSGAEKKSPRAWADSRLAQLAKVTKDLKVRPESWREITLSGHPAVTFIADYEEFDKPHVFRGVYAIGQGENAEELSFTAEKGKFEHLETAIDSIVKSYQAK